MKRLLLCLQLAVLFIICCTSSVFAEPLLTSLEPEKVIYRHSQENQLSPGDVVDGFVKVMNKNPFPINVSMKSPNDIEVQFKGPAQREIQPGDAWILDYSIRIPRNGSFGGAIIITYSSSKANVTPQTLSEQATIVFANIGGEVQALPDLPELTAAPQNEDLPGVQENTDTILPAQKEQTSDPAIAPNSTLTKSSSPQQQAEQPEVASSEREGPAEINAVTGQAIATQSSTSYILTGILLGIGIALIGGMVLSMGRRHIASRQQARQLKTTAEPDTTLHIEFSDSDEDVERHEIGRTISEMRKDY